MVSTEVNPSTRTTLPPVETAGSVPSLDQETVSGTSPLKTEQVRLRRSPDWRPDGAVKARI